jgi:pre-mRNA-splicing factor ISY1
MARSAEKAMALMNRWVDQQRAVSSGSLNIAHRPRAANECKTVREAESQRYHIIRQLTGLISQIQNANLSQPRIRQINDEINKLLKVKYAFELRIKHLGGPDYSSVSLDSSSITVPGDLSGYRYFGAAKTLPGVQELLEEESEIPSFRSREEILKNLDIDYFGYRDEIFEEGLVYAEEHFTV